MTRPVGRQLRRSVRSHWPIWGAASLLLHAVLLWALVPHEAAGGTGGSPPELEVEMVQQAAETRGRAASTPRQPQARPTPPAPTAPVGQAAPAPAIQRPAVRQALPSEVNLDGGDKDQDALHVTGQNVVPPRPDALVHNEPPHYPAAAVRRHAQGLVVLTVHVTSAGVPAGVDITRSSGDVDIDDAARDAVALWRFHPARRDGRPVPFDYEMSLDFGLDTR